MSNPETKPKPVADKPSGYDLGNVGKVHIKHGWGR